MCARNAQSPEYLYLYLYLLRQQNDLYSDKSRNRPNNPVLVCITLLISGY